MQDDRKYGLAEHSFIADSAGNRLLDYCDEAQKCHGETAATMKASLASLIQESNDLTHYSKELPKATLSSTLGAMLDVPKVRNRIPAIIHGLKTKDATHLESAVAEVNAFYTELMQGYSQFSSSIPLVQIISQSENNTRLELTAEEVQKREKRPIIYEPSINFLNQ